MASAVTARRAPDLLGGRVSAVGLGTAALGVRYGTPGSERAAPDRAEAVDVVSAALDAGITFLDTAPAYGDAELAVGLAAEGRDCVVATKLAVPPAPVGPAVRESVERSLARLRRDRIDLLQLHNAEARDVEREDVLEALDELLRSGLVTLVGVTVYDEAAALAAVESSRVAAVQLPYSILDRRPESRVLGRAEATGTAVIARSVLARGALSPAAETLPETLAPVRRAVERVRDALGLAWEDLPAAALAWVLARPEVTCALVGPRTVRELRDALDGAERLYERVSAVDAGPPLPDELLDLRRWPEPEGR